MNAHWTKKQFREYKGKSTEIKKPKPEDRFKNQAEREYVGILEKQKRNGDIKDWKYEPYSIRLADNTFIRVDFVITTANGQEIHEVKGHERPAWKVKWKVLKEMYAVEFYRFLLCKKIHGAWQITE